MSLPPSLQLISGHYCATEFSSRRYAASLPPLFHYATSYRIFEYARQASQSSADNTPSEYYAIIATIGQYRCLPHCHYNIHNKECQVSQMAGCRLLHTHWSLPVSSVVANHYAEWANILRRNTPLSLVMPLVTVADITTPLAVNIISFARSPPSLRLRPLNHHRHA